MGDTVLQMSHVDKSYRTRTGTVSALTDVSIGIGAGEFVAMQGPSGSGKTTALLVAAGLLDSDRGEVVVDGASLGGLGPGQRASLRADAMGFAFQQFHLVPYLSVLENVLVPGMVSQAATEERARELIERFGLQDRLEHKPSELSAGEQQRTALARALVNRPKIILADEPTGNLDPDNADVVLSHLAAFASEGGAVLLVTHDQQAADTAQRRIRLESGSVVAA